MSSFSLPSPVITSVTTAQQSQYSNVMTSPASFSSGNQIYHSASVQYEPYLHQWHSGGVERVTSHLYDATTEANFGVGEGAMQSRRSAHRITTCKPRKSYKKLTTSQAERMQTRLGKETDASVAADFGVTKNTIQKRRSSLGIPVFQPYKSYTKLTQRQSESAQPRLRKETDARIAADFGVNEGMIRKRRNARVIAASKLRKPYTKLTQSQLDSIQGRLGKEPDASIAADFGVTKKTIQKRRSTQGIAAYESQKSAKKLTQSQLDNIQARLGKEPDASIAADFKMSKVAIQSRRNAQGIAAYQPHKSYINLTHSQLGSIQARLGIEPDARIAADFGVSISMIQSRRSTQGIAAYQPQKSLTQSQLDSIQARLGKEPDARIAADFKVSKTAIYKRRNAQGIAAYNLRDPRQLNQPPDILPETDKQSNNPLPRPAPQS